MILETKNLTKLFNLRKAMDGLNLEIQDGSVYGVLGPNGSGKSTTIRMMTDLIRFDGSGSQVHLISPPGSSADQHIAPFGKASF